MQEPLFTYVQIGRGLLNGGPASLFLAFTIWCTFILAVTLSMAEMVTYLPISSPFIRFAGRYVDEAFGFAAGWNFFVFEAALSDVVPAGGIIAIILVLYGIINVMAVQWYGETEFWAALGKFLLIVGLIIFTFIVMLGGNPLGDRFGFRYWYEPGAFTELYYSGSLGRFLGFLQCLIQASFTIAGPDYVAMAAGEAENPRKVMPRAFNAVFYRLTAFFVLGSLCVGILVPYNDEELTRAFKDGEPGASASPYVVAMNRLKISGLPHIVNAMVLTAAFSAGNSYVYCASRSLYGLALEGKAPAFFKKCTKKGVPVYCVIAVLLIGLLSFLQLSANTAVVLNWFVSLVTASQLINFSCMCTAYLGFYRALKAQGISRDTLPYKAWFQPYAAWYGLIGTFIMTYTMVGIFPVLYLGWKFLKKTKIFKPEEVDLYRNKDEIDEYERTFVPTPAKEEDWLDVDGDLDTEEGAEAVRCADVALHATIERAISQRDAQKQQGHLTDDDRQILLSRGDVVGKALARPNSLSIDEMHQALLWPPPDVVRANIQRATGGQLSTPIELYAKGETALDRGQFSKMLNDDEVALLARHFHARDDATFSEVAISQALGQPGVTQAAELLASTLGLDFAVFHAALMFEVSQHQPMQQMTPAFSSLGAMQSFVMLEPAFHEAQGNSGQRQQPGDVINAMTALREQHQLGNLTDEEVAARNSEYLATIRASSQIPSLFSTIGSPSPWPVRALPSRADRLGSDPWPPTATPCTPITLFAREADISSYEVGPGLSALPEEQKAAYRTRSETLRRDTWVQREAAPAERPAPFAILCPPQRQQSASSLAGLASHGGRLPGVPVRPGIITGLSVFRDEQDIEWQELLRQWEALPGKERQTYEARAVTANATARAAFDKGIVS
ncbi:amino acid permease [Colletotrichum filicis]|nr:amino acid permease [Colletotrichum filicis]